MPSGRYVRQVVPIVFATSSLLHEIADGRFDFAYHLARVDSRLSHRFDSWGGFLDPPSRVLSSCLFNQRSD